ncbi:hypothetical protein V5799_026204, partial [Amblyomma americanum]
MEDHLKCKDRLDREWEALCAYEADPCSTAVASLPANMKKNRYPDVLTYDHSRVILNDVSNANGSDYINASTIVHLVSEHIWCDDYLVRSFYLKNLKTSETRTVTQFHFLSWPDNGIPASVKALLEFR